MDEKAWLDVSVLQCPECRRYYAEASWYAVELESDTECGSCQRVFNTKKHMTDRVMLEFQIDGKGKALETEITEHIPPKRPRK